MLLFLLTRWRVKGKENIPSQGPVLIIANHLNVIDPPLLGVSISRRVIFIAKEELFRSRLAGYFFGNLGSFPVHRGRLDRKALRQANQVLAANMPLAVFPEGKRSHNTQLQPAFSGAALIASHNKAVLILPVGISGTEKIKGKTWILHRPRIIVNIGPPFRLPLPNGKFTKGELTHFTTLMMERVAELLPLEYQGNYIKQGDKKNEG